MLASLVFLLQVKVKKSITLTKIVENEEVKIHIFWETSWIPTKLELMMTLKATKNKTLHSLHKVYFLKYILRVKVYIFFNENKILVFAKSAIFHSIQIKTSLKEIVRKITTQQVWCLLYAFWHLPKYVVYAKVLALVHDPVQQFYGNCQTLNYFQFYILQTNEAVNR